MKTREELISAGLINPPRSPTVSDRRRISDALEEHYDLRAERYLQSWSDERLGAKLDLPRAWVTDVRVQFFGAGSTNEADNKTLDAIADIKRRLAGIQGALDKAFGEIRTLEELIGVAPEHPK